jgi:PIN domain nuclease of toxin-antitoxin system
MRALLDTYAFLWWVTDDHHLSPVVRALIADGNNEILVSAASAWEIATKHRLGKLPQAGPLVVDFAREVQRQGFVALPITLGHAQIAGSLAGAHRDPFDRMLIAQAQEEKLALLSLDRVFDEFGIVRVW